MKYNIYTLIIATLFAGSGLNGQEENFLKGKFSRVQTIAFNFCKEVVFPSLEIREINTNVIFNNTTNRVVEATNLGVQGFGDYVDTGYTLHGEFKSESLNQLQIHVSRTVGGCILAKERGYVTKERVEVAVGVGLIAVAIYYRNEIGNGISYAAQGTCNQVGRAAGWVASLFKSSPKQDALSK